ncbi:MAG: LysR substrate-binding domain-containing protein [Rhodospirillales bacterium]|nr:LysR substrate-binding domain-containing protein [Rhodospirillales bacterium]
MNQKQLEAFRAVMIGGSTVKAAEILGISQPAVTRLISALEQSCKLRLFTRKKRRLQPTTEAISFFHEVERLFVSFEKLKKTADEIRNQSSGHLRVVCLPSFAFGLVPRIIRSFREFYPSVTVSLQVQGSATFMKWVSSQQFNVGIAQVTPMVPDVETRSFATVPGVCVLPPGHFLAERPVITAEDLRDLPFVSFAYENSSRAMVDQHFQRRQVDRVIVMETHYAATVCQSVLEGIGVSIVNPLVARDYENNGLVIRRFEPSLLFQTTLIYPHRPAQSQLTTAFVSLLEEERNRILDRYELVSVDAETDTNREGLDRPDLVQHAEPVGTENL